MSAKRSPITTHVLDIARGKPAAGLAVTLEARGSKGDWKALSQGKTNADGRVEDLLAPGTKLDASVYRLTFETGRYLEAHVNGGFYPLVTIVFEVKAPDEHYHVPLLLSPHGYSTYRGS